MVKQTMANARIPEQTMLDYFQKLFIATLQAISNSDEPFLREYLEHNLVERIMESNKRLSENNLFLQVKNDIQDDSMAISSFCEVVDGLLVKGLTSNRELNGDAKDYHLWSDLDDMGVAVYTHKKYSDPQNFIDPEENKRIYDDYEKVLVRLLLSIKTPYVLNIMKQEGKEDVRSSMGNDNEEETEGFNEHDYDIYGNKKTGIYPI
jgi:hypothetical protein